MRHIKYKGGTLAKWVLQIFRRKCFNEEPARRKGANLAEMTGLGMSPIPQGLL